MAGLSVTNGYDQYLRRTQLAALSSTTPFLQHAFGYDNASRLQTVTDNSTGTAYSATYSYLANSPLVGQITFKQSTTTRMTTSKQYDYLNRLSSISSSAPSFAYSYNSANQRIRSTLADGSYWLYTYDSMGQVVAGSKYWSDGTPVAGQQFDYTFDTIGNRTATLAGGDQNGANLRSASYSANNLNQYTSRGIPGDVDVMGLGFATNAVTVNGQTAYRKGEYFRQQLTVNNGSTPVWQSVTNAETGQSSVTGGVFVPKTAEQFSYDGDGNLTNDGRWRYAWDAENRLVTLTTNTAVGPQQSISFEYDWKGRRIHKQVWSNPTWNSTPTNDVKFVYDGWNLLAELNSTNNAVIRSFMWGLDLSGSPQGAGGVGGLLEVIYTGAQTTNCFVALDGNGNVAVLTDAGGTGILAQYEYGPFGEVIRATGPMAKTNPFRFSTKYQDDETDLFYYIHRYYNPSTGRWLSSDPLPEIALLLSSVSCKQETDGRHGKELVRADMANLVAHKPKSAWRDSHRNASLYAFVENCPIGKVDVLGLDVYKVVLYKKGDASCGCAHHRLIVGDNGNGGYYELEVQNPTGSWRGQGIIVYDAGGHGSAKDEVTRLTRVRMTSPPPNEDWEPGGYEDGRVVTTSEVDAMLADLAATENGKAWDYTFISHDCGTFANQWLKYALEVENVWGEDRKEGD